MKKTILSATFLMFSAGAAAVGALDNLALQGSDTLEEFTKDILASCPGATGAGISYAGGGSTTGENAMSAGTQTVAPMSRFLNPTAGVCAKGSTAEGIVVALDGVAVVAGKNNANACGGALVANNRSFAVTDSAGAPVNDCTGCAPGTNTYTFTDWKDVLSLVYAGKPHAGATSCGSDVRKSLVKNWGNLFQTDCAGSTCTELKHAFRRNDLSGTTDTFLGLVGLPSMPLAKNVAGASAKAIAFCNADGAGAIFGGDSDFLDRDPIRRTCDTAEQACGRDGTLGLVTVVEVPANLTAAQSYPTQLCTIGKFRLLKPASSGITTCPNGKGVLFGKCFQPTIENADGTFSANCIGRKTPVQGFAANGMDGRAYNLVVKADDGSYRKDNTGRFITGAFYRLHSTTVPTGGAGPCQTPSSTEQIGCLVAASPCSIGFAGREAITANNVGLKVNGITPEKANIEALTLTATTSDDYPLARKLFFNSIVGFENVTGGELELAKCMGDSTKAATAAANRGFVPVPGGVFCQDFNEAAPAPGCAAASNVNACANNPAGIPSI